MIEEELEEARLVCERTDVATRSFKDLQYRTKKSWSRSRRVVAKAEQLVGRADPRFVVTSLDEAAAAYLTAHSAVR